MQKLAKVSKDGRKVDYTKEVRLSNEEDAPMTLAVDRPVSRDSSAWNDDQGKRLITGVNSSSSSIQGGSNDHCRVYSYGDKEWGTC